MIRKLTLAAGFGAGYVLGAKAGTQRYNQIMDKVNEFMGKPAVQSATSSVQQTAGGLADKAKSTVNEKVESVTGKPGTSSSTYGTSTTYGGSDVDLTVPVPVVTPVTTVPPTVTPPMPGAGPSLSAPDL